MKPILRLIVITAVLGITGCQKNEVTLPIVDAVDIDNIVISGDVVDEGNLIEVLRVINQSLEKRYPEHPHLPLIIERHEHPNMDRGHEKVDIDLIDQDIPLLEVLQVLATGSLTHWRFSDNGYIIFKTWHRPQYDWDDEEVAEFLK
ncbi:MAG: hypothetical protein ACI9FG_001372 [Crocinitomicaceae bacterium]|jgi:hypothetical protein